MERERLQIKYNKQILVEGRDAYYFLSRHLKHIRLTMSKWSILAELKI